MTPPACADIRQRRAAPHRAAASRETAAVWPLPSDAGSPTEMGPPVSSAGRHTLTFASRPSDIIKHDTVAPVPCCWPICSEQPRQTPLLGRSRFRAKLLPKSQGSHAPCAKYNSDTTADWRSVIPAGHADRSKASYVEDDNLLGPAKMASNLGMRGGRSARCGEICCRLITNPAW